MDIATNRIGKLAMIAAMSSDDEEIRIKEQVAADHRVRLTVTYVSGRKGDIERVFVRSLIGAALKADTVQERAGAIHAVIHAGLEAWHGLTNAVVDSSSLKIKVAIVSDGKWVAIAAYGDSAMHQLTNHERIGLGVMHL
ncbi:HutP family protein [Rhodoplanes sp. TEM]|uniref:Hut operon positive regulatory protein n=1 Tax=Rhodoplanes tepidamans TaxID=200616 RepID=A0ABT5J5R8_RHOTP|nr:MULTISPECIES: HutP family protein [Rhodoplanes]MDC7784979.1 HutP family protein [Rhodoplanes tepidamans]MDC7985847.1 HutP family protein [Rhodoplanes sp. TEM]MDQ0353791.1 hut operon positive regulator [Rhodoplanes tepidamans]